MTTTTRQQRGLALFRSHANEIVEVSPNVWRAPSCSGGGYYRVNLTEQTCKCPDHQYRSKECKHLVAATVAQAKDRCRRASRRPSRNRRDHGGRQEQPPPARAGHMDALRPSVTPDGLRGVHADPAARARMAERMGV